MIKWMTPPTDFIKRVKNPVRLPDDDTLARCMSGLQRQIRNTKSAYERQRLRVIYKEIKELREHL
jgi:hypothetical protein